MTREEAIRCLSVHSSTNGSGLCTDKQHYEAKQMAIKSLEQEPKTDDDCISREAAINCVTAASMCDPIITQKRLKRLPSVKPKAEWISINERLPETDNENRINNYNVLLWVKDKTHPEKEPQIYLGKLRHIDGDDGSGNFWGIKTKPCEWTIWGWSYFFEPEVIAWMPLPQPYKAESEDEE